MALTKYENGRLNRICRDVGLVLYLCGGWRSYKEISNEFGWACTGGHYKSAHRNVQALELAGLPIEFSPAIYRSARECVRVRLPADWVARTPWLRRYIIRKEPLNAPAYRRSLHK